MGEQLVDFSVLEDLSGGDRKYKYELLEIFHNTMDSGLDNLQRLTAEGIDYDAIFKQAHALKSSAAIVQVKDMHRQLTMVENMARDIAEARTTDGKAEIGEMVGIMLANYQQARPEVMAEYEKNKPGS